MESKDTSPPLGGDGGNESVKLMTEMILRSASPEHMRSILEVLQKVYATGMTQQNSSNTRDVKPEGTDG
jgi:hypothetical protein